MVKYGINMHRTQLAVGVSDLNQLIRTVHSKRRTDVIRAKKNPFGFVPDHEHDYPGDHDHWKQREESSLKDHKGDQQNAQSRHKLEVRKKQDSHRSGSTDDYNEQKHRAYDPNWDGIDRGSSNEDDRYYVA